MKRTVQLTHGGIQKNTNQLLYSKERRKSNPSFFLTFDAVTVVTSCAVLAAVFSYSNNKEMLINTSKIKLKASIRRDYERPRDVSVTKEVVTLTSV